MMNPEGSLGLDQSMYRARRSGCPGKTDDLLVIPIPEGTALSGEKHRTTCFNKIVTNPSRSHPVSLLCQIPCQMGNLRPLTASCPVLGFVFPPAVFHLPFCSSCVAIYRFLFLMYALSRWVSVNSYPPMTSLIS